MAALPIWAAACGSADGGAGRAAVPEDSSVVTGGITVLAASSLTGAFDRIGALFESAHPGVKVTFGFGASTALAEQVRGGAPADVIATAEEQPIMDLVAEGLARRPRLFARNHLAILVGRGNPLGVKSLADLARPGLILVLCAPEVPCGSLAQRALHLASVEVKPRSLEADVKAATSRVVLGEADAAVVYATEVRAAGDRAAGVAIAAEHDLSTDYAVSSLGRSANPRLAALFVMFLLSPAAQRVLFDAGFDPS